MEDSDSSSDDSLDEIPHEKDLKPKFSYKEFLEYCTQEDKAFSQRKKKKKADIDDDLHTPESSSNEDVPSGSHTNKIETHSVQPNSMKTFKSREEMRELKKREKERLGRTVYVGNLPPNISKKSLNKLFSSCGSIDSIRIRGGVPIQGGLGKTARKMAVISKEFSGGEDHRLCAYVVFKSKESIEKALLMNNSQLSNRNIRVDTAGKVSFEPNNCVFIGNLHFHATEEEVREQFQSCGEILNIRLIRDRVVGAVKGFGYIEFRQPSSVVLALKHSGNVSIKGRPVRIERVSKKHKKKDRNSKQQNKEKFPNKSNSQSNKKPRITLPTNLKGTDRSKFLRNKQKKIGKRKKRLASKKSKG